MNKRTSFLSSFDFLHVVKNSLFALEIFLGSRKGAAKQQEHTHMYVQTPQFLTPVGISLIFICHTQTRTPDHMYGCLVRMIVCDRLPHLLIQHAHTREQFLIRSTVRRITRGVRRHCIVYLSIYNNNINNKTLFHFSWNEE